MIELVIKIPEEMYAEVMDENGIDTILIPYSDLIKNGTPLPKGHGRLKDVDWIDENCKNYYSDTDGRWCYAWRDIDEAPTIIEADKGE